MLFDFITVGVPSQVDCLDVARGLAKASKVYIHFQKGNKSFQKGNKKEEFYVAQCKP